MAAGENQKENLIKNLHGVEYIEEINPNSNENSRKKLSFSFMKNKDDLNASKRNIEDLGCCCMSDRTVNDVFYVPEKNTDDITQSSDSLSSSASLSDSDLTSTDSEDSLALSESESITDVTPLNSPYCDSPLPLSRHTDHKAEDKNSSNTNRDNDCVSGDSHRPEMNVLMKAIEKIELEAKSNAEFGFRESLIRRRATSFSSDETKKVEQENQRLLKRVISQQNRIRSIYSTPNQPASKSLSYKHHELVKSDSDISEAPKKSLVGKYPKDGDKSHGHRRQKCLSHPSSFIYSCNHRMDKTVMTDGLCCESYKKKKINDISMKKHSPPQNAKASCEGVCSSSDEMN